MATTTYTVTEPNNGYMIGRHLTVREAAESMLSDDGQDFEIRETAGPRGGRIFDLWTRQQVANIGWGKTVIFSFAETREAAEAEIFQKVFDANWPGYTVLTDAEYEAECAEDGREPE